MNFCVGDLVICNEYTIAVFNQTLLWIGPEDGVAFVVSKPVPVKILLRDSIEISSSDEDEFVLCVFKQHITYVNVTALKALD